MKFIIKHIVFLIGILALASSFSACKKETQETPTTDDWSWETPSHFPAPHYQFDKLAYSKASFELGKKLFFDPILSKDNTISCGSCHQPEFAFTDNSVLSPGVDGQTAKRHTPALVNLAWQTNFMWDGGVNHLEVVSFAPITNTREMDETMANVVQKLNSNSSYKPAFAEIFETDSITDQQLLLALTIYMSGLVSANSSYDQMLVGEIAFDATSSKGYNLFQTHCSSCHSEPLLTNNRYQNNGLDLSFSDSGRYLITLDTSDLGKFKVPSLRNIALTAPYMHDGRFSTLREVINHYSEGIKNAPNLASELPVGGFQFSEEEISAIETFLQDLTDYEFINNENFAP